MPFPLSAGPSVMQRVARVHLSGRASRGSICDGARRAGPPIRQSVARLHLSGSAPRESICDGARREGLLGQIVSDEFNLMMLLVRPSVRSSSFLSLK